MINEYLVHQVLTENKRLRKQNSKLFQQLKNAVYQQRYYMQTRGKYWGKHADLYQKLRNKIGKFESARKKYLSFLGNLKNPHIQRSKNGQIRNHLVKLTNIEYHQLMQIFKSGILMHLRYGLKEKYRELYWFEHSEKRKLNYFLKKDLRKLK